MESNTKSGISRTVEAPAGTEDTVQANILDEKGLPIWHLSEAGGLELNQTKPDATNNNPLHTRQCGVTEKSS